jgi:predicted nucleotidyltransferase
MSDDVLVLRARASLTPAIIAERCREPLRAARAHRAVLFGSYARGDADGYSDVDLVVVLDTDRPFVERALDLGDLARALPVGVDVLVYTPQEFDRGLARGVGVFDAIAREGQTVYERPSE